MWFRRRVTPLKILLSMLSLVLLFGGAWLLASFYQPPSIDDYRERSKNLLEDVGDELGLDPRIRRYDDAVWIDEEKKQTVLTGYRLAINTSDVAGVRMYGDITPGYLEDINKNFTEQLSEIVNDIFTSKRYVASSEKQQQPDDDNAIVTAYERGPIKCIVMITAFADPFADITCGTPIFSTSQIGSSSATLE